MLIKNASNSYVNAPVNAETAAKARQAARLAQVSGGKIGDNVNITKTIFPNLKVLLDYNKLNYKNARFDDTDIVYIALDYAGNSFPRTIKVDATNETYVLSHAAIIISGPAGGHAVCGFICRGGAFVYDSAYDRTYPCNWPNGPSEISRNFLNKSNWKYQGFEFVPDNTWGVYIRKSLLDYKGNANIRPPIANLVIPPFNGNEFFSSNSSKLFGFSKVNNSSQPNFYKVRWNAEAQRWVHINKSVKFLKVGNKTFMNTTTKNYYKIDPRQNLVKISKPFFKNPFKRAPAPTNRPRTGFAGFRSRIASRFKRPM